MSNKSLGIAFIGAGEISILHGRAVREIPDAHLVGLWNRTESRAIERAEEEGCRRFATPEELVNDPEVDAVIICTNLETHLEYAELAMKAGKDVLVEKPLCGTVAEVEQMKKTALETGKICMPGHNMIHEASLQRAKKLIENGDLGNVVSCYVLYNIYHDEKRASTLPGVVRQLLTHHLYTLMYLVGRPVRAQAFKTTRNHLQPDHEDLTMVNLELESGALGHLCASFAADDLSPGPWTFTVKVIGSAGTTHYTYNDWVEVKKGISHSHTYTAYQDTITNEVRQFVELCRAREGEPSSTLDDAVWAQKSLEAIEKSIAEGITADIK